MKKPKNQIFNLMKSNEAFNPYLWILKDAENLRELRSSIAYNYSKYTCLKRQDHLGRKHFLGEVYFTDADMIKRRLFMLEQIAQEFGYDINRLTW